jgi:hypothetical protein
MANTSYTRLITTTLQHHGTEIFDAVSTNNALFYMLKKRGNIKVVSGGRVFTHPVYHTANTSFRSYAKLEAIDTPVMEDITRAEYPVKVVAGSMSLSVMEEAMNAGNKEKLIDLAREVKEAAQISMTEEMGDQVWADGSATNDFDGIQHLISLTPSTGTVGGINRASYSYWRNQTGTNISNFNTSDEGITNMNSLYNSCVFGSQGPTAVFTTKTVYGYYELSMTSNIRHLKTELGDAGFVHLAYKTLPVLFDDNCPGTSMYMVDLNNLWLQLLSRGNFAVRPFQTSINQLSRIALMYVFGNITMGSARTNGVIETISD